MMTTNILWRVAPLVAGLVGVSILLASMIRTGDPFWLRAIGVLAAFSSVLLGFAVGPRLRSARHWRALLGWLVVVVAITLFAWALGGIIRPVVKDIGADVLLPFLFMSSLIVGVITRSAGRPN